ncbi:efflux RND transporter periplasmic adaptor subunit [Xanthomarina sp. GH4-25]|uniref:efflux RND transporter periplasmic adaptor subunit n=1 Tax=Xanthomarina sp. GH4-25 TaxID=3349335 RepID=UPI003877E1B4
MKNNKIVIYIGLLAIGILFGWFIFGGTSNNATEHNHEEVAETNQMWTCSMHPQIMQPEPGDCPICGMDLIPADSGEEGLALNEIKMTENAMALANIQTTIVGDGTRTDANQLSLSGKIMANEEANAVQASYFEGRIEKLNVNFTGEEIRKGQLLATIYAPNLVAAKQELLTASSMKATQPALYKAVRNKLILWKLSDAQISQIESSGKVRENFPIYATVSGTVSQKMVEEGDYVKQGQPIVKVSDLGTVWAMFDSYENQISQLKEGQTIKVTSNAYPDIEFDAKVSFINPVLDTKSRTVAVRATLNNKDDLLKPGMFVTGKLEVPKEVAKTTLMIPATAILWTGNRSLVYVKTNPNEPIFEMREVTLGNKNGDVYAITEGLVDGDEVVTNGTFTVDAAAQLQGKKSMMNKEGAKATLGHEGHVVVESSEENHFNLNERVKVSDEFKNQLRAVFNDYIQLKDALVKDDSKKVKTASQAMVENLSKVDMKLLKDDETHHHWMTLEKEITASVTSISNCSKIKEQRTYFKSLSSHLTNAIEVFGINEKVYHQFCPMVDNNTGGYWLSKEEKVFNPYFGDAMLTCGEVKQVIE